MPASSIGASRRSRMPRPTLPLPGAFPRLWAFAIEHLLLLPLGAAIALVWVNTSPESYYEFVYAVGFVSATWPVRVSARAEVASAE